MAEGITPAVSAGGPRYEAAALAERLERSLADLEWAVSLVPERLLWLTPPFGGPQPAWSVAMNLAHLLLYEERIPAQLLEEIAAGGTGSLPAEAAGTEGQLLQETRETAAQPIARLLERLRVARSRQAVAVRSLSEERLNLPLCTLWSAGSSVTAHPAGWIAAKTFQHTWEHGTTIQQIALFGPMVVPG
jgi:hypothetical protein